jgi:hypothetical protein
MEKIPVPKLDGNYEKWCKEIRRWSKVTSVSPEKQTSVIALSLPERSVDPNVVVPVRDLVLDELDRDEKLYESKDRDATNVSKSVIALLLFLDNKLAKDDLEDCIQRFFDFDDIKKTDQQPMAEFVAEFDERYRKMNKKGVTLPPEILAFKLLKSANIDKTVQNLVKTGMNFNQKNELYEQTKKSLLKFSGSNTSASGSDIADAVKLEPAWLAEKEDVLWAAGGYVRRDGSGGGRRNGYQERQPRRERVNVRGNDGKPLQCHVCGSVYHFWRECPKRYDKVTTHEQSGMEIFLSDIPIVEEEKNYILLDTGCTSTVCGKAWLDCYLDSLPDNLRKRVRASDSKTVFRFGGGECLSSLGKYEIPVLIHNHAMRITTEVVDSAIPLLWSKSDMKDAGVKIDFKNDQVELFNEVHAMEFTTKGHVCINLEIPVESVFIASLVSLQDHDVEPTLLKLHRQFGHASYDKLKRLIEGAGQWDAKFAETLQRLCKNCQVCKKFTRTPSRPVVGLPMAGSFNEVVCMDLKVWKSRYILHIIDMFSRLTISVFVESKKPSVIVNAFMRHWVGAGFGFPSKGLLTDNGGEFCNNEFREMASIMGICVLTTGAEAP